MFIFHIYVHSALSMHDACCGQALLKTEKRAEQSEQDRTVGIKATGIESTEEKEARWCDKEL